jgi:hypothetical protein
MHAGWPLAYATEVNALGTLAWVPIGEQSSQALLTDNKTSQISGGKNQVTAAAIAPVLLMLDGKCIKQDPRDI